MRSDDLYFPFNHANVIASPRPMITPTYFDNECCKLHTNSTGGVVKTTVGYGTDWPIGLFSKDIFDWWANVKMMAYHIDLAFLSSVGFNPGGIADVQYDNQEVMNASGVLRRCQISSASIFKYAFKSFKKKGSENTTTDDILIDFTKGFSDYRTGSGLVGGIWWFPYIRFNIAGTNGYILNGSDRQYSVDFQGLPIPSLPIEVRQTTYGTPIINPVLHRADIQVIERIDQIDFTPSRAVAGTTEVTITLPAFNPTYDGALWRDGLEYIVELTFGKASTTEFTKIRNSAGVVDTIKVVPPAGSTTGVIKFKSVLDPTKEDTTSDFFTTRRALTF